MFRIHIATNGQKLIKVECPKITSGDKNADYLYVDHCPSWDGFGITAVFYRRDDDVYYAVLDGNNECVIPWEVLQTEGVLYLGIFGVKDDIRQTSEIISYKIEKGAIVDNLKPSDPTPDIYNQIIERYAEVANVVAKAENHLKNEDNPHKVTKSQVGLENVDNTSDADKPVSTAQAVAIADAKKAGTDAQSNLDTHAGNKNNPHGVTAKQVGAVGKFTKIWTNGAPAMAYSENTLSLDLSGGTWLMVVYRGHKGSPNFMQGFVPIVHETEGRLRMETIYGGGYYRHATVKATGSSGSLQFTTATKFDDSVNNADYCIPYQIYIGSLT